MLVKSGQVKIRDILKKSKVNELHVLFTGMLSQKTFSLMHNHSKTTYEIAYLLLLT